MVPFELLESRGAHSLPAGLIRVLWSLAFALTMVEDGADGENIVNFSPLRLGLPLKCPLPWSACSLSIQRLLILPHHQLKPLLQPEVDLPHLHEILLERHYLADKLHVGPTPFQRSLVHQGFLLPQLCPDEQ